MMRLEPRIQEIVTEHLDAMERAGPPVDLVQAFALPIPSLVICELLGVPYARPGASSRTTRRPCSTWSPCEQAQAAAGAELLGYLARAGRAQAGRTRRRPAQRIWPPELTHEELAGVGLLLLVAGHETTANMLGARHARPARHPDQLAVLRRRPELIGNAVEELLRYLTIIQIGRSGPRSRTSRSPDSRSGPGETVRSSLPTANRDPERFPGGDALDLTRPGPATSRFGHGIHQCLGQQLARLEMRSPTRRSSPVPRAAARRARRRSRCGTGMVIYGVHRLPVTW